VKGLGKWVVFIGKLNSISTILLETLHFVMASIVEFSAVTNIRETLFVEDKTGIVVIISTVLTGDS